MQTTSNHINSDEKIVQGKKMAATTLTKIIGNTHCGDNSSIHHLSVPLRVVRIRKDIVNEGGEQQQQHQPTELEILEVLYERVVFGEFGFLDGVFVGFVCCKFSFRFYHKTHLLLLCRTVFLMTARIVEPQILSMSTPQICRQSRRL